MKSRQGFVSNSSSSSFIIINKTAKQLSLVDFVIENSYLLGLFLDEYECYKEDKNYTIDKLLEDARKRNEYFNSGSNSVSYGDEDGDTIGTVFDYILRDGGNSLSFEWYVKDVRGSSYL